MTRDYVPTSKEVSLSDALRAWVQNKWMLTALLASNTISTSIYSSKLRRSEAPPRLQDGYKLMTGIPLCMHSLASILPHYNALTVSKPEQWGLAGKYKNGKAYVQCLDPQEITGGGTAIFEISAESSKTHHES